MIRRARKNRKEQYPVYLRITVDGIRAEIATKVMASVEKWNVAKGRLNGTVEDTRLLNRLLDNFEHKAREIYNRLLLEGKNFTAKSIKNEITGLEHNKRMLIAIFQEEVAKMELREGNGYATGTLKTWNVTLRHLRQFLKEHYTCDDISFRQVDYQFISDLDWFARTKWKCQTNVVLKHMQRLQRIIKMAMNRGWLRKNPFENFHCKPEKSHCTFLSKDELRRIESKTFSVQRLENVKDIFIFSCYTGLAYVDIAQLSVDNLHTGVDGKQWIYTFRQKKQVINRTSPYYLKRSR